jgi:DNA-binding CsgD family transcriptional regulator
MKQDGLLEQNQQLKGRVTELENILDQIPASVYINQIDTIGDMQTGKNIWSNKYGLDIVGYTQEQATRMGYAYFTAISHPDDASTGEDSINKLKEMLPGEIYKGMIRIKKKDGDFFWCLGKTKILKYKPDGVPWQFLSISVDIPELSNSEKQLDDAMKEIIQLRNKLALQVLTKREKEILGLIAQGLKDETISKKLFISQYTVHTHRNRLIRKTNTGNTAGLVAFAVKCGLG